MTGKEGKLLLLKNFEQKFKELGFVEKKRRDTTTEFIRNNNYGFDLLAVDIYTYSPNIKFGFVAQKRIDKIELILKQIGKNIELSNNNGINKEVEIENSITLSLQNKPVELTNISFGTEEELVKVFNKIFNYMVIEMLPKLDSFNDLRNIDNKINGEGDLFWEFDSARERPFTLAHIFYGRRLTIARLCKKEVDFNHFINKFYAMIDSDLIEDNRPILDRNDFSISTNYIIKYLKGNVKPIY